MCKCRFTVTRQSSPDWIPSPEGTNVNPTSTSGCTWMSGSREMADGNALRRIQPWRGRHSSKPQQFGLVCPVTQIGGRFKGPYADRGNRSRIPLAQPALRLISKVVERLVNQLHCEVVE